MCKFHDPSIIGSRDRVKYIVAGSFCTSDEIKTGA